MWDEWNTLRIHKKLVSFVVVKVTPLYRCTSQCNDVKNLVQIYILPVC